MQNCSTIESIETRLTNLISMKFLELRTMASNTLTTDSLLAQTNPTACSCEISFHLYCWYTLIFIFEIICLIFIHLHYHKDE